jgi:hypothetical protein
MGLRDEIVKKTTEAKAVQGEQANTDAQSSKQETQALKQGFQQLTKFLVEDKQERSERNQKIKQFIMKSGSDEAKEVAREL